MPKPTAVGLPYEDVTLTTPDHVKIKAYVIPARRRFVPTEELQAMSAKERKERGEKEIEAWAEEMGKEDAIEVGADALGPDQGLMDQYARGRPTVVIFHANAGA